MVKNVKQSVRLQAGSLLSVELLTEEITKLSNEPEADQEELKRLIEEKPELKQKLSAFGVDFPSSPVEVSFSLGAFIYSILSGQLVRPSAPLKLAAYNKTLEALRTKFLVSDEFEMKQDELLSFKRILDDDALWANTYVLVTAGVNGAQIPVNSNGISLFNEVVDAAIAMYEEEQAEKDKEKEAFEHKKKIKKKGK